jgi:hypothetical protein
MGAMSMSVFGDVRFSVESCGGGVGVFFAT